MKTFILLNAIVEIVAGMIFFLYPGALPEMQGESAMVLTLTRMYGGAALALGYYALMVWRNFSPGLAHGFLKTFLLFHASVSLAAFFGYSQGIQNFIAVCALHGILALATGYFAVRK